MNDRNQTRVPDPKAYAERLGLEWPLAPTLENLNRIIQAHQYNISFENIDCFDKGRIPSLDIDTLFHKVVVDGRGGYCFELNALFNAFLHTVGYDSYPISCCILRGRDYVPPMLHRATIVVIDGRKFYCDIAYGGPQPAGAVPLGGTLTVLGERFLTGMDDDGMWHLDRFTSRGDLERVIGFWDAPMYESYFVPYNYYCATNEDSLFRKVRILNRRTPHGSVALNGNEVTEHRDGQVYRSVYDDPEELADVIRRVFGLNVTAEDLRGR